jgi:hypothetical protein
MVEEDPYASIRAVLSNIERNDMLTALQCDMLARLRLSGRVSDAYRRISESSYHMRATRNWTAVCTVLAWLRSYPFGCPQKSGIHRQVIEVYRTRTRDL